MAPLLKDLAFVPVRPCHGAMTPFMPGDFQSSIPAEATDDFFHR